MHVVDTVPIIRHSRMATDNKMLGLGQLVAVLKRDGVSEAVLGEACRELEATRLICR